MTMIINDDNDDNDDDDDENDNDNDDSVNCNTAIGVFIMSAESLGGS